jgi:hypothetical protein
LIRAVLRLIVCLAALAAVALAVLPGANAQPIPLPPLPPPPVIPPIAVPDALKPVAAIAGPATAPECGIVGLIPGLLGEEAGSLPFDPKPFEPYLAPLLIACAAIPQPTVTHTCALDKAVGTQIRAVENKVLSLLGILPLPAPEGIAVDTLGAADAATGGAVPSDVVASLATALSCTSTAAVASGGKAAPVGKVPAVSLPKTETHTIITPTVEALQPVKIPAVVPAVAPAAQPKFLVINTPGQTKIVALLQHWHPVFTVLLVVALVLIGLWAWRAERRDAHKWADR